jgi:hypothetical protein
LSLNATAVKLSELIRVCGSCGRPLESHHFALFASIIAGQQEIPRLTKFFQLAKQSEWETLAKFQEWDGTRDVVEAFAVRCPGNPLQMVILKDVFDPLAATELYIQDTLGQVETEIVLTLVPHNKWQAF